ncbi:MAG: response regulator, partial [Dehalococcoidia bacterium]
IKLPAEAAAPGPATLLPEFEDRDILSVLVVDDEPLVADVFRAFLESSGHRAVTCLNGTYALQIFQQEDFDLAVVDLGMPNMDGWEFSRRIHQISPSFPIIVATGWNVSLEDGTDQGVQVQAVLKKPFGKQELTQAIDQAMETKRLR